MDADLASLHTPSVSQSPRSNGSASSSKLQPVARRSKRPSSFVWLIQFVLRLLLWGSVFTVLFRCPQSQLDIMDDSPVLCEPYFRLRSQLAPHLSPHYATYVKPYVDLAQPHIDGFNKNVYAPAAHHLQKNYDAYAAPRVAQIRDFVGGRWDGAVEPRLQLGKQWVSEKYDQNLSPHIEKAVVASDPYVRQMREELLELYESTLVPIYDRSLPYMETCYQYGHYATFNVMYPYIWRAQSSTSKFLSTRVWPRLVLLYGINVEPQLMRIRERLGRYTSAKKLQHAIDDTDALASITAAASRASSAASSSLAQQEGTGSATLDPGSTSDTPSSAAEPTDISKKIESDLKNWQSKFAKAADKGAEDLEERVRDITQRQIEHQAHGVGQALVTQLDTTTKAALKDLKSHINTSISKIPADATESDENTVYIEMLGAIRSAGEKIRNKAVAVRSWKQTYDNETDYLVKAALDSTLEVIDSIRDLGLQEIGMRWAHVDGMTYKDWTRYHALKKTFDTWRDEVGAVAMKHGNLEKAKHEGEAVQDEAMQMAESAAKELTRLKDVARWKVDAHDSSDDFSSKVLPGVVKAARSIILPVTESVKRVMSGAAEPSHILSSGLDQLDALKEEVNEAARAIKESAASVAKGPQAPTNLGPVSAASEESSTGTDSCDSEPTDIPLGFTDSSRSSVHRPNESKESPHIWGGAMAAEFRGPDAENEDDDASGYWADQVHRVLEAAGEQRKQLTEAVHEVLFHRSTSDDSQAAQFTAMGNEQWAKALSAASSVLLGTTQEAGANPTSYVSARFEEAVTAASNAIFGPPTPVAGSAVSVYTVAASKVQEALASMTSVASVRLAEGLGQISAQYTNAKIAVGAQPPPLHQQYLQAAQKQYYEGIGAAYDQYTRFVDAASSNVAQASTMLSTAVYGTPTGVIESATAAAKDWNEAMASRASENFDSLVSKASQQIYGTPTPFTASVFNQAGEYAAQATDAAASHYSALQSIVSELVIGKEPDFTESVMMRLSAAYYTGAGQAAASASSMASEAYESASSVLVSVFTPPPQLESIVQAAGAQFQAAVDAASVQLYGTSKGPVERAGSAVVDGYSLMQSRASEAVYGTQTGYLESAQSSLAALASDAQLAASEAIYGTPTPTGMAAAATTIAGAYSSVTAAAGENLSAAGEAVGSQYSAVSSQLREMVYGPELNAWESASTRIAAAAESAAARIAEMAGATAEAVREAVGEGYASVDSMASRAGSAVRGETAAAKDEL